jgi:hypothetical protein
VEEDMSNGSSHITSPRVAIKAVFKVRRAGELNGVPQHLAMQHVTYPEGTPWKDRMAAARAVIDKKNKDDKTLEELVGGRVEIDEDSFKEIAYA